MDRMIRFIEWVLRIGTFGIFLGHGIIAFSVNPDWIPYLTTVGFSPVMAEQIMPVIGTVDIAVATLVLIRPLKPVVIYAFIWAFLAALIRPISGESMLMFVERAGNWATPLALYLLLYYKKYKGA